MEIEQQDNSDSHRDENQSVMKASKRARNLKRFKSTEGETSSIKLNIRPLDLIDSDDLQIATAPKTASSTTSGGKVTLLITDIKRTRLESLSLMEATQWEKMAWVSPRQHYQEECEQKNTENVESLKTPSSNRSVGLVERSEDCEKRETEGGHTSSCELPSVPNRNSGSESEVEEGTESSREDRLSRKFILEKHDEATEEVEFKAHSQNKAKSTEELLVVSEPEREEKEPGTPKLSRVAARKSRNITPTLYKKKKNSESHLPTTFSTESICSPKILADLKSRSSDSLSIPPGGTPSKQETDFAVPPPPPPPPPPSRSNATRSKNLSRISTDKSHKSSLIDSEPEKKSEKSLKMLLPRTLTRAGPLTVPPSDTITKKKSQPQVNIPLLKKRLTNDDLPSRKVLQRTPTDLSSSSWDEATAVKRLEKRKNLIGEILTTEINYLNGLTVLKNLFRDPLLQRKIISMDLATTIFSPFLMAFILFSETLRKNLQVQMPFEEPDKPFEVGAAFLEMIDLKFVKSYSNYILNYSSSMSALQEEMKKVQFLNFKKDVEKSTLCQNLGLEDFLINIIQRIPQYIMLLTQLSECTPCDNPDYDSTKESLLKLKDIAENVNIKKKQRENLQIIQKIHLDLKIKKYPKNRELLHDDIIYDKPTTKTDVSLMKTSYHIYLFSDTIIIGKYQSQNLEEVFKIPYSADLILFEENDKAIQLAETIYYARNRLLQQKIVEIINQQKKK